MMHGDPKPGTLTALIDERATTDVLMRYAAGVDTGDMALLRSAYPESCVDERCRASHGGWQLAGRPAANMRTPGRGSTHLFSNVPTEFDGDAAAVESYGSAMVVETQLDGEVHHRVAVRYLDRFERRDGVSGIVHRRVIRDWTRVETVPAREDAGADR